MKCKRFWHNKLCLCYKYSYLNFLPLHAKLEEFSSHFPLLMFEPLIKKVMKMLKERSWKKSRKFEFDISRHRHAEKRFSVACLPNWSSTSNALYIKFSAIFLSLFFGFGQFPAFEETPTALFRWIRSAFVIIDPHQRLSDVRVMISQPNKGIFMKNYSNGSWSF